MSATRRLASTLFASCFALSALSACAAEDTRLFKEPGVWSVTHFSADGAVLNPVIPATQEDAFMFNFNREKGVVATAACAFGGGGNTPASSTCGIATDPSQKDWECKCYSYEFEGEQMRFTEFAAGQSPPPVGSSDTDGANGTSEIEVSDYVEVNNSYSLTPLPGPSDTDLDGLFGSNGVNSVYVILKRFDGVFEESGCAAACFGE